MVLNWRLIEGLAIVWIRVPESFVALFQAIIESYEGVAFVRTHDVEGSVMMVVTTTGMIEIVNELLNDLGTVMPWTIEERNYTEEEVLKDPKHPFSLLSS